MGAREKLIEILRKPIFPHEMVDPIEAVADYLLDSGVTVQEMDGCEFCNAEYAEWSEGVSHDFRIKGNALYYYDNLYGWEGITIHHCPMCGRRLPQPPKGE